MKQFIHLKMSSKVKHSKVDLCIENLALSYLESKVIFEVILGLLCHSNQLL